MKKESWTIQITQDKEGFWWDLFRNEGDTRELVENGFELVLGDAVYSANRALDPFFPDELR